MTIVLNEHEWAKNMIDSRSLGKKPSETLCRVARYYIDKKYSKKDVRRALNTFLLQCDPTAPLPKWVGTIDRAMSRAFKRNALEIDCIHITKPEMEAIKKIQGRQPQRLAFTLLCLAKYWDLLNSSGDHWVNSKDNEIMKMANINTSIKRQSALFRTLNELGLIQFSKKVDNTNVRVCFMADGDPVMDVSDFRNLGYQYQKFCGEPFYKCENCGIVSKIPDPVKGRKVKYCKDCAKEVQLQQIVNSAMRRQTNKTHASV